MHLGYGEAVQSRPQRHPEGAIVFLLTPPTASKLALGYQQKKTVATVVTTVAVLIGGEDKIRTCGRITPTAV